MNISSSVPCLYGTVFHLIRLQVAFTIFSLNILTVHSVTLTVRFFFSFLRLLLLLMVISYRLAVEHMWFLSGIHNFLNFLLLIWDMISFEQTCYGQHLNNKKKKKIMGDNSKLITSYVP